MWSFTNDALLSRNDALYLSRSSRGSSVALSGGPRLDGHTKFRCTHAHGSDSEHGRTGTRPTILWRHRGPSAGESSARDAIRVHGRRHATGRTTRVSQLLADHALSCPGRRRHDGLPRFSVPTPTVMPFSQLRYKHLSLNSFILFIPFSKHPLRASLQN
jgi:hypothetical protein